MVLINACCSEANISCAYFLRAHSSTHGDPEDWLHECWGRLFQAPTLGAVGEGQYRCFFAHSFDCKAGPSRAYYFESWPAGEPGPPVIVLIHVHYWDMPPVDSGGRPKHINVRRGWRVDRAELQRRADGDCHDPVPPPADMRADLPMWVNAMKQFLHDRGKDPAAERARAREALDLFEHPYFCPEHHLWLEKRGECVHGGPTVQEKKNMESPGWDFTARAPYPFRARHEYVGGFVEPKVPVDIVADVLEHAEFVRVLNAPGPVKVGGVYDGHEAWRGGDTLGDNLAATRKQAQLLADLATHDDEDMVT